MQRAPLSRTERLAKRACDVVLTLIALGLLAPLMLMVAFWIKLSAGGPAIIREARTGFDGRKLYVYKFGSPSATQAETQIVQTLGTDLHIAKARGVFGPSSVEELPQLFNVLKGEMSLVGPPPQDGVREELAAASRLAHRLHFKPGVTGWARVNGLRQEARSKKDLEARGNFDLWYVNNWSLALDLKIIWRTLFESAQPPAD